MKYDAVFEAAYRLSDHIKGRRRYGPTQPILLVGYRAALAEHHQIVWNSDAPLVHYPLTEDDE